MGVGSLLDVMHEQELDDGDDSENAVNDNEDYDRKSDTAEDFSDITELAEDLQTAMQVCDDIFDSVLNYFPLKLRNHRRIFLLAKYKNTISIRRL